MHYTEFFYSSNSAFFIKRKTKNKTILKQGNKRVKNLALYFAKRYIFILFAK